MVDERYLMQGLMQRGLPEHIAQGFVMNMRDESGLNPGINERNPIVPGSRGGFGLYQLTGPRRRAYEQFARQRGVDFANADAQLDFLMTELQGPESRAAQSIFAAQDAPTAAAAIARDFLRPAPENLQKRVQQYTGGTNMQRQPQGLLGNPTVSTQGQAPQQAPAQEEERAPFFQRPGVGNFFDTLAMGLEGMTLNPNQGIIQGAQQRMQQRREMGQMEQQRNRTADWLESQGMGDLAQGVRSGALGARDALTMARGAEATSKQRDYQYLLQQGVDPRVAMERVFGGGGTTVNVGSEVGTIPQGYELFTDPETGARSLRPIAGGPVAAEREEALKRQKKIEGQRGTKESVVSRDVDRLIGMIDKGGIFDLPEAGIVGGALANLGINQEAVTFRNTLAGIQSQVAFDRLQQMREASKTGGALGAVSERELDLLMSALGALQQTTDPQTLKENLKFIRDTMTKIENDPVASQAYYGGNQSQSQSAAPGGGFSVTGVVD